MIQDCASTVFSIRALRAYGRQNAYYMTLGSGKSARVSRTAVLRRFGPIGSNIRMLSEYRVGMHGKR
jgi:hypothetical protein